MAAGGLAACAVLAGGAQAAGYDSDTVIVQYASGVSTGERLSLFKRTGVVRTVDSVGGLGAQVVQVEGDPADAAQRLNTSALVRYAEPNYILRAQATPNDPLFSQLYGLHNTGQTGGSATPTSTRPRAGTLPGSADSPPAAARRSASSTPASTRPIPS